MTEPPGLQCRPARCLMATIAARARDRGWWRLKWFLLCVFLAGVGVSEAQEQPGTVYVTGGVSFSRQAVLPTSSPPPFAAPGGRTSGALVGGGVFVSPRLSLETEVWRTGVMRSRQSGRHNTSEVGTRQDWFVAAGVKVHVQRFSIFRVEPVAGIVFVGNEGTYSSFSGESRGYYPLAWNPGLMFGVDLRIGGGRIAFVPGVRFAFTGVPKGEDCFIGYSGQPLCRDDQLRWEYLYPKWTQRPSLSVGVTF